MIINIRGTSGSGKTTAIRGVMHVATLCNPLAGTPKKPNAYQLDVPGVDRPVFIIGSYENVCGGCDAIPTQDAVCDFVRHYAPRGHVLFEGLLISHLFSRYQTLDREHHALGIPYIWAFLDTPLDLCLKRVADRREARGASRDFNPTNTTQKWHDMRRVFVKAMAAGLDVRWLSHQNPDDEVLSWLRQVQVV